MTTLITNSWFQEPTNLNNPGLFGWVEESSGGFYWNTSKKPPNPENPSGSNTAGRFANGGGQGCGASYAGTCGVGEPGVTGILSQVVASPDTNLTGLQLQLYWVTLYGSGSIKIYGGATSDYAGTWTELADIPVPSTNGDWLLSDIFQIDGLVGYNYYKVSAVYSYPSDRSWGFKLTGIDFQIVDAAPFPPPPPPPPPPPDPPVQIFFVGGTGNRIASGAELTVPAPEANPDDLMLAILQSRNANQNFMPSGYGWELIHITTQDDYTVAVFAALVDETTPGSYSFTREVGTGAFAGTIVSYRNADRATIISSSKGKDESAPTTITTPSITADKTGIKHVAIFTHETMTTGAAFTTPAGLEQQYNFRLASRPVIMIGDRTVAAVGSQASYSSDLSLTTGDWVGIALLLEFPPPPPPPPPYVPPIIPPPIQEWPGLSVEIGHPLVSGLPGLILQLPPDSIEAYSHTIDANFGFAEATIKTSRISPDDVDQFGELIGGDVKVFSESGLPIWEGFVNKVDIQNGPYSYTIGPYTDMVNYAFIEYTTLQWDTNFPVGGEKYRSDIVQDAASILRYGRLEGSLSSGEISDEQADSTLALFVQESARPSFTQQFSFNRSSSPMGVTITCVGYGQMLAKYVYENFDFSPIFVTATQKLADVLNSDPNGLFANAPKSLQQNATQLENYEDGGRFARAIVDDIVSIGSPDLRRWLFFVDNGLKCVYKPVDSDPAYIHSLYEPNSTLRHIDGSQAMPWEIRPGRWLMLDSSDRLVFIESVKYTAPFSLELSERKVRRLDQALARLGLGSGVI